MIVEVFSTGNTGSAGVLVIIFCPKFKISDLSGFRLGALAGPFFFSM